MPIYEYECTKCSCRFEIKQSFSENKPVCCPDCQAEAQRIFSPVPIIFKGPGFYVTDSKNSSSHVSSPGKPMPKTADKSESADKSSSTETK